MVRPSTQAGYAIRVVLALILFLLVGLGGVAGGELTIWGAVRLVVTIVLVAAVVGLPPRGESNSGGKSV